MSTQTFGWRVERFSHFRGHLYVQGWAFHHEFRLRSLFVQFQTDDVSKLLAMDCPVPTYQPCMVITLGTAGSRSQCHYPMQRRPARQR